MIDKTEIPRKEMMDDINSQVASEDPILERIRLEKEHGKVWDYKEVRNDFEIEGFMAPCVMVRERKSGKKGSLEFQHLPRFYFNFIPD